MASTNDVPLTLSVTTVGTDSVRQLQEQVLALAKQGGDAAPAFQHLAEEIGKLGQQTKLTEDMRNLGAEVERLAVIEADASVNAAKLGTELTELSFKTTALRDSEREAKAAVMEAQRALFDKRQALAELKNETSAAEKESSNYTGQVKALNSAIIQGKTDLRNLTEAYREAKTATAAAATEERSLASAVKDASREAGTAKAQIETRNQALRESQRALSEAGVAAKDTATAEVQLLKAYMGTVEALDAARIAQEQATAAARRAAQEDERLALIQISTRKALEAASRAEADGIVRDYARMEKAERDAASAAQAAAQVLANAFRTVGVRSADELRNEIQRVNAALDILKTKGGLTGSELNTAFASGQRQIKQLEMSLREVTGQTTLADRATKMFASSMGQITAGNVAANAIGYLSNKVGEMGRAFIDSITQIEQMRRGLNAIYGDATTSARQIDFLRKAASDAGVSVGGLGKEFVKFSASMHSANIPLEQSNALFRALTTAGATLGLTSDEVGGALNSLAQMASKGVVSMEELRQQLGDRLPGSFGLVAKGLGITEAQLNRLVESGGLAARDLFPALTKALGDMKGETDGLIPTFERLKGTLTEISQGAGDAGWTQVLGLGLKVLGGVVGYVALGLSTLSEAFFLVVKSAAAMALALTGEPKAALQLMADSAEAATKRLTGQANALNKLIDPAQSAATAMGTVATAAVASAAAVEGTGKAHAMTALAAKLNADATLDLSTKQVQFNVAMGEVLKTQEAQTDALEKSAKAAKTQGDTLVELARLQGEETVTATAAVEASRLQVEALDKVAAAHRTEVELLTQQKAFTLANAAARKLTVDQIKVEIDAIDKKLVKSQAENEQSKQAVESAKAEAFARNLAAKALENNAAKVAEYKAALDAAVATLKEYERLSLNGKTTDEQVAAARRAVTQATVMYKDALRDQIAALELSFKATQANLQLTIAQSNVAQQASQSMAAQARAIGDVETATYYEIKAKEQAIATLKLEMEMRRLEADLALKSIEIKRKSIDATTDEGQAKLKMLDIEAALIKVKLVANDAAKETIKGIEREIQGLREGTGAREQSTASIGRETGARGSNTDAIRAQEDALMKIAMQYKNSSDYTEKEIDLLIREAAAREKLAEFKRKEANVDKDGFVLDKNGQRLTAGSPNGLGAYNKVKEAGGSDDLAMKFAQDVTDKKYVQPGNGFFMNNKFNKDISDAVLAEKKKTALEATPEFKKNKALQDARNGVTTPSTDKSSGGSSNKTVTINIGGRSQIIGVASQEDADTLVATLRQIESASQRAT